MPARSLTAAVLAAGALAAATACGGSSPAVDAGASSTTAAGSAGSTPGTSAGSKTGTTVGSPSGTTPGTVAADGTTDTSAGAAATTTVAGATGGPTTTAASGGNPTGAGGDPGAVTTVAPGGNPGGGVTTTRPSSATTTPATQPVTTTPATTVATTAPTTTTIPKPTLTVPSFDTTVHCMSGTPNPMVQIGYSSTNATEVRYIHSTETEPHVVPAGANLKITTHVSCSAGTNPTTKLTAVGPGGTSTEVTITWTLHPM